jgi:hypothetical protein
MRKSIMTGIAMSGLLVIGTSCGGQSRAETDRDTTSMQQTPPPAVDTASMRDTSMMRDTSRMRDTTSGARRP